MHTLHVGCIGRDGEWILDLMRASNVNVELVTVSDKPTGKAIIQLSLETSDNAIILSPNANYLVSISERVEAAISMSRGWMLFQNEINYSANIASINLGLKADRILCLNPTPFNSQIINLVKLVHVVIMNKSETECLSGNDESLIETQMEFIMQRFPNLKLIVTTLGEQGAIALTKTGQFVYQAIERHVSLVDTTGAGDTFLGYFVSFMSTCISLDLPDLDIIQHALKMAVLASGLACEANGAMPSIPKLSTVLQLSSIKNQV
jgi:ribokinase